MSSASFQRMANKTAIVKRTAYSGGTETGLATVYASVPCLPLDPVDPETRERMGLNTPNDVLKTTVDGAAFVVKKGDVFAVAGKDYPVRAVSTYEFHDGIWSELILEDLLK